MTRGRYASSAEAKRAREDAESEVEAGRRKIASQAAEIAQLRATLAEERQARVEREARLVAMMNEGASPAVSVLRGQVEEADARAAAAKRDAGQAVARFLGQRKDWKSTPDLHASLAEVLGLSLAEYFARPGATRYARRQTPRQFREGRMIAKANPGI